MIFLSHFRPDNALSIKLYALKKLEVSGQSDKETLFAVPDAALSSSQIQKRRVKRRNVLHDLIKFAIHLIVYYFFQKRSILISCDKAIKFSMQRFFNFAGN